MNMSSFSSEGLKYKRQMRAKRGKKGEKKTAMINSWSWGCSQVNLCGFIWPWFGANEQMERVTKTQDSSLPGETHNTFLLSPVIKRYPTIHWHTHTHTHKLSIIQGWRGKQLKKRPLQGLLNTGWKLSSGYKLRFLPELGCVKLCSNPPGGPYWQRLIHQLSWYVSARERLH